MIGAYFCGLIMFASGNHSFNAIILDHWMYVPTCVEIAVFIDNNFTQCNYGIEEFVCWMNDHDIYDEYINDIIYNTDNTRIKQWWLVLILCIK